jgi:hypothetical protein
VCERLLPASIKRKGTALQSVCALIDLNPVGAGSAGVRQFVGEITLRAAKAKRASDYAQFIRKKGHSVNQYQLSVPEPAV